MSHRKEMIVVPLHAGDNEARPDTVNADQIASALHVPIRCAVRRASGTMVTSTASTHVASRQTLNRQRRAIATANGQLSLAGARQLERRSSPSTRTIDSSSVAIQVARLRAGGRLAMELRAQPRRIRRADEQQRLVPLKCGREATGRLSVTERTDFGGPWCWTAGRQEQLQRIMKEQRMVFTFASMGCRRAAASTAGRGPPVRAKP